MAQAHTRAERFQALIGGLVLAAAIWAFCSSPLSQHANGVWFAESGFMLAAAVFAFYQLAVRTTLDPRLKYVAWAMAAIGMIGLAVTFADAIVTAQDYDVECATQQQRMLHGDSAGSNSAGASGVDIFRALRCDYSR